MDPKIPDDGCLDAPINAKVAFLRSPDAYADSPPTVQVTETHMSWVFLAGQLAYKLKKPVRYEFLDFSTVEARRKNCEREVELNRRLAGDVYCGVVPLVINSDGRLQLEGQGNIVDWLVKMRRLPAHQMLIAWSSSANCGSSIPSTSLHILRRIPGFPATQTTGCRRSS